jgi:hypothetical protein
MSDRIVIENGTVLLETEEGKRLECPEARVAELLRKEAEPPLGGRLLPDGIKLTEWRPPFFLVVHQYPAQVRLVRWIANNSPIHYGPGTEYRPVLLSLPYAITFAMFALRGSHLVLGSYNELYFSNQPLERETDKILGYPPLLNVSRIPAPRRERSWICTQHLRHAPGSDWTAQLDGLLHHMWNGGFNLSSEHHEGASWYSLSREVRPAVHPVEKWEEASRKDKSFGQRVAWKPVPMSVRELVDSFFAEHLAAGAMPGPARAQKPAVSIVLRLLGHLSALKGGGSGPGKS